MYFMINQQKYWGTHKVFRWFYRLSKSKGVLQQFGWHIPNIIYINKYIRIYMLRTRRRRVVSIAFAKLQVNTSRTRSYKRIIYICIYEWRAKVYTRKPKRKFRVILQFSETQSVIKPFIRILNQTINTHIKLYCA
jgi:hypothetical protein